MKLVFQRQEQRKEERMIFWEPKTDAEKKLLELYAMEEHDIQDHDQKRSRRDRKRRRPGQEFYRPGRMCEKKV